MHKFFRDYLITGQNLSSNSANFDENQKNLSSNSANFDENQEKIQDSKKFKKKIEFSVESKILDENFMKKNRQLIGILIPILFFWTCWWCLAIKNDFFEYFPKKYFMSITMMLGSFVAGSTSEGGGAVAFPVMTLGFSIEPTVARDFSLMIQSCGTGFSQTPSQDLRFLTKIFDQNF